MSSLSLHSILHTIQQSRLSGKDKMCFSGTVFIKPFPVEAQKPRRFPRFFLTREKMDPLGKKMGGFLPKTSLRRRRRADFPPYRKRRKKVLAKPPVSVIIEHRFKIRIHSLGAAFLDEVPAFRKNGVRRVSQGKGGIPFPVALYTGPYF